jgi:AcrR family transcriptional regulator
MKSQRIDVAGIRREQIVEAAVAVITEQGLQNLSLAEIEKKAEMSRGQLTYYFPTKEEILLAVFDRLVKLIHERVGSPAGQGVDAGGWEWIRHLLRRLVTQPPVSPEFGCLQYTFLSQIGHREDFRRRLAGLYEQWRTNMSQGLAKDLAGHRGARSVSPRALATLVQAILHGLAMQRAADPDALDPEEMVNLSEELLGGFLRKQLRRRKKPKQAANKTTASTNGARARTARRAIPQGVNGERSIR